MTETLLGLVIKSIVLSATAFLTVHLLRRFAVRRISSAMRHRICLAAMIALAILPILAMLLPAWRVAPAWLSGHRPAPVRSVVAQRPVESPVPVSPTIPVPDIPATNLASTASVFAKSPEESATDATAPRREFQYFAIVGWRGLAALYIFIIALQTVSLLFGHSRIWQMVRRAKPVAVPNFGTFPVRESPAIAVPLTVGIGSGAVIVLPEGLTRMVAEDHLAAVLAHETAHIERGDYLSQLFADCVCILYCWNPIVWLLRHRLRDEAERAADDRVITMTPIPATDYAEHLLATVRRLQSRTPIPVHAVNMARHSEAQQRIAAILATGISRREKLPMSFSAGIGAVTILLSGCVSAIAPAARLEAETNSLPIQPIYQQSLSDGTEVAVVAINDGVPPSLDPTSATNYWKPDGTPYRNFYMPSDAHPVKSSLLTGWLRRRIVLRLRGTRSYIASISPIRLNENSSNVRVYSTENNANSYGESENYTTLVGDFLAPNTTATFSVGVPREHLDLLCKGALNLHNGTYQFKALFQSNSVGPKIINRIIYSRHADDGDYVTFIRNFSEPDSSTVTYQFLVRTKNDKVSLCNSTLLLDSPRLLKREIRLPCPISQVKSFEIATRDYDWVTFSQVALQPAKDFIGKGMILFRPEEMRPGFSRVLGRDGEGREIKSTFERAYTGNKDIPWTSTQKISIGLRWRTLVPPGESPSLGAKPVLLLKNGRVQLPYGRGAISETTTEGSNMESSYEFRAVPVQVVGLLYVPASTPYPDNDTTITYPGPRAFQPIKMIWEQIPGTFRTEARVRFQFGHTNLRLKDGSSVEFLVKPWDGKGKMPIRDILQIRDTLPRLRQREVVLVEKDGKRHFAGQRRRDSQGSWMELAPNVPRDLLARIQYVELVTRPVREVPSRDY